MPEETVKKPRRRRKPAAAMVKVGKRTLRGDRVVEAQGTLILFVGLRKRIYINLTLAPLVEVTSDLVADPPMRAVLRDTRLAPSAPKVSGGLHDINLRKAAAATASANADLEQLMGPDFSTPISDDPAVE